WMLHQRVQHPELGYGQVNRLIVPGDRHAVDVHGHAASLQDFVRLLGCLCPGIGPAQQSRDAGQQVVQAHVFGDVVIGGQTQTMDRVYITVSGGQENDRQSGGLCPQVVAQGEATFRLIAQADIYDGEIRQALAQNLPCGGPVTKGGHPVAPALEGGPVVIANACFVFNQNYVFFHGVSSSASCPVIKPCSRLCTSRGVGIATIHHFLSPACPLLPR